METGSSDAVTAPGVPFALLAGAGLIAVSPSQMESALRHMGLQPEVMASGDGDGGEPAFRLHFGGLRVSAVRADAPQLRLADPDDRATSLLGVALPRHWRETCWIFVPEVEGRAARSPYDGFYRMLVLLIDLFDAQQLFWSPARLWTDARQFRGAIAEMQTSGMPPVLHLVAFRRRDGAAGEVVTTRGLAAFAGQELEAPVPAGWDMAAMVQRLARLALDIMINGPVARAQQTPGLGGGEWVAMTPRGGKPGAPATLFVEFLAGR